LHHHGHGPIKRTRNCIYGDIIMPTLMRYNLNTLNLIRHHRFSLIELLVVIAIISILAAMLMPVLRKSIETARMITCTNNFKQIGLASNLYSNDNLEYMPPAYVINNIGQMSWDDLLGNYDGRDLTNSEKGNDYFGVSTAGRHKLYRCPSYPFPYCLNSAGTSGGTVARSYSMNAYGNLAGFNGDGGLTYVDSAGNYYALRISRISAPSRVLQLIESPRANNSLGNGSNCAINSYTKQIDVLATIQVHCGPFNYLFCDGHASFMIPETTQTPINLWTREQND